MTALLCCLAGSVGIGYELYRPGLVLPGTLGLAAILAGAYSIWRQSPNRLGLALLIISALLFAAEAAWDTRFVAGALASAALAAGMRYLLPTFTAIPVALNVSAAALLGMATIWLLQTAKRARRNKLSDL